MGILIWHTSCLIVCPFKCASNIWCYLASPTFNSTNEIMSASTEVRNVCKAKLSVTLVRLLHPITKHFDHESALIIIPASWCFLSLYHWCCFEGCVEYNNKLQDNNNVHMLLSLRYFFILTWLHLTISYFFSHFHVNFHC